MATRVKNKNPAPIQITAEQILREARERQAPEFRRPKQIITDPAELADYQFRKRKEFEESIRRHRGNLGLWMGYAQWEAESQKDFKRARSVCERAYEVHYRNPTLWLRYAEMEMKNKFVDHARKVWDRAVSYLPFVDQLWYKYIHMEEMLGNVAGARQIFERWMDTYPDQDRGWLSYIKFELRYRETDRARTIYQRFLGQHSKVSSWINYAKFEMKNGETALARKAYREARSILSVDDEAEAEKLFIAFAEFEESCREVERARCVYKDALDHIPKGKADHIFQKFIAFEKQYGDQESVEDAIIAKNRLHCEEQVKNNPLDYDVWFDYVRLEKIPARIREIYEQAIANLPLAEKKQYWKRYIYLWINYALYEELDAQDMDRAREVYRRCLRIIPHRKFSFAKIWILAAQFEIREGNLKGARQILGNAIGQAPKDKIFTKYIEMELQLGNIDRCRKLYNKYVECLYQNCSAWKKYAEFEKSLEEIDRAREIFELGISQSALDMPELLWDAYIGFERSNGEVERTRQLYERLLGRTKHVKVWISYAEFEAASAMERARDVFERAVSYYRTSATDLKEERALLMEEWLRLEKRFGDVSLVECMLPKKLKKRVRVGTEEEEDIIEFIFPEEARAANLKIMEAAYQWKKKQKKIALEEE